MTLNSLFLSLSFVIFSLTGAIAGGGTPEELYKSGKQKLEAKQYDEAIKDFSKVIDLNEDYALAYFRRGSAYYLKNDFTKALRDFDRYLSLKPNDENGY